MTSKLASQDRAFIESHRDYRSTDFLDRLRAEDHPQLDAMGHVYLDFTGGNLAPSGLIRQHLKLVESGVFGNPHSTSSASQRSTVLVDEARREVLRYFNASADYICVFTSNATSALKVVGESYPFHDDGFLLLSLDNHNSVNGIREFAKEKGACFKYVPVHQGSLFLNEAALGADLDQFGRHKRKLFAFPAQSNVSGIKHPLSLINMAKQRGWDVLLDAAAFVPADRLDLGAVKPDFVSISFYKMFGYPTGVGCLLVHKDAFDKLQKPWYAGGTIQLSAAGHDGHFLKENEERFEDGTVNYLGIPAVATGLRHLERAGIERIKTRVRCLTSWLIERLSAIRHGNGRPLVRIYGSTDPDRRGGTVAMNFYDAAGNWIPFWKVDGVANQKSISIRTGCFCNPGLDEVNSGVSPDDLARYFGRRVRGDYFEMMRVTGKGRGSLRVSLGLVSNVRDVNAFVAFAEGWAERGPS